jgi:CheY-like chemotaxis protein
LDLDLPDMTGIATARAIKKLDDCPHPYYCLQCLDKERLKEEALHAGMVDYLQKSIPSELIKQR